MRSLLASLIPAAIVGMAVPVQAATLDDVSAHLRGISTMSADFVQTDRAGKSVTGTLRLP